MAASQCKSSERHSQRTQLPATVQVLQELPADVAGTVVTDTLNSKGLEYFLPSVCAWPSALLQGWMQSLLSLDLHGASVEDTCRILYLYPQCSALRVLHLDLGQDDCSDSASTRVASNHHRSRSTKEESCGVLRALEARADHLSSKLQVLGLHNVPRLHFQHCMQISRAFACLASSPTGLTVAVTEKKLLFKV